MPIIHDNKNYGTIIKIQDKPVPVSGAQFWIQNDSSSEQVITIPSPIKGFQMSTDSVNWSEPTAVVFNYSFQMTPNQRLYVKIDQIENESGIFRVSDAVSLGGNISTLFNKLSDRCYKNLILRGTTTPISVSNLTIDSCTARYQYEGTFIECYGLTDLPQFTCKTVSSHAFYEMFSNTSISELPTGLFSNIRSCEDYAFARMFANTQITTIPVDLIRHIKTNIFPFDAMFDGSPLSSIPEGYLDGATGQLQGLFVGCSQLKTVPQGLFDNLVGDVSIRFCFKGSGIESVPDDLIENIYPGNETFNETFMDCRSLTKAPRLPRNPHWDSNTYTRMFDNCTSLTEAPEIWAEWSKGSRPDETFGVFYYMFGSCFSLTKGAKMHWNGPLQGGDRFRHMYDMCSGLQEAYADFTQIDEDVAWIYGRGVQETGTLHVTAGTSGMYQDHPSVIPAGWTITEDYSPEYLPSTYNVLVFTNLDASDNTLTINYRNDEPIEYQMSTDGSNWEPLAFSGAEERNISFSNILYIRSETGFGSNGHAYEGWRVPHFRCSANWKLGGRIVKLDSCELTESFNNNEYLIDSSELVIDPELVKRWNVHMTYAFNGTFNNCSAMEHTMIIPDIECGDQFYHVFDGCSSLQELRVEVSNATYWMPDIAQSIPYREGTFTLYKKFGSGVKAEWWMTVEYI